MTSKVKEYKDEKSDQLMSDEKMSSHMSWPDTRSDLLVYTKKKTLIRDPNAILCMSSYQMGGRPLIMSA